MAPERGGGTRPPTNTLPVLLQDISPITRFEEVFRDVVRDVRLDTPPVVAKVVPFEITGQASASGTLLARLDPVVMTPRRTWSMLPGLEGLSGVSLADTADRQWIAIARGRLLERHGIELAETFDRIMAAPDLPAPSYTYLAAYDRTRFVPGIDQIEPDTITILNTNPRFIEAYLAGLNHEMNRELLWRAYPTDQRGTPFRYFWAWRDGNPDIDPMHRWSRRAALGTLARGAGPDGQVVLLVRGELLRRYPNTQIFAWKCVRSGGKNVLQDPPGADDIVEPVFAGRFDPDFAYAGFPLTLSQLRADPDWFFVLAEQPMEPRFGFDEPEDSAALPPLRRWNDANWGHTGVLAGRYVRLSETPLANRNIDNLIFGENSAHLAAITFQRPMRIAVFSKMILDV